MLPLLELLACVACDEGVPGFAGLGGIFHANWCQVKNVKNGNVEESGCRNRNNAGRDYLIVVYTIPIRLQHVLETRRNLLLRRSRLGHAESSSKARVLATQVKVNGDGETTGANTSCKIDCESWKVARCASVQVRSPDVRLSMKHEQPSLILKMALDLRYCTAN